MTDEEQPHRPVWGNDRYAALKEAKQEITIRRELFHLSITASTEQTGEIVNNQSQPIVTESEKPFLIDFTFKPIEPSLKLHPEEIELLLAYLGEILAEIEQEDGAFNYEKSQEKETT